MTLRYTVVLGNWDKKNDISPSAVSRASMLKFIQSRKILLVELFSIDFYFKETIGSASRLAFYLHGYEFTITYRHDNEFIAACRRYLGWRTCSPRPKIYFPRTLKCWKLPRKNIRFLLVCLFVLAAIKKTVMVIMRHICKYIVSQRRKDTLNFHNTVVKLD